MVSGAPEQIGGLQRVPREHVLDVHQEKFLVLLLMVQPQGDQVGEAGLIGIADKGVHCLVDELAVARDLVDART